MIYFDTESVGLTGPCVLIQYAEDDSDITLHEVFNEPISKTLDLIEYIVNHEDGVCAFNITHDWFHLSKTYNILRVFAEQGYTDLPYPKPYSKIEKLNPSQYCLRPHKPLDLMLIARQGKYQYVMSRKPINIRRVPRDIAPQLKQYLESNLRLPDICFSKDPRGYHWRIQENDSDSKLVNLKLVFSGSTSLRALSHDILGEAKADWPIPKDIMPTELMWYPFGQHGKRPWLKVIHRHIEMWNSHPKARYYAEKDVYLLRRLHREGFADAPRDHSDSLLACDIASARHRGFAIDHERIKQIIPELERQAEEAPKAPKAVHAWISHKLSTEERLVFKSTDKKSLQSLVENSNPEAAQRASAVLHARKAQNRLTLLRRLLTLPSFHPDFKVIGTKSNRKSGGGEEKHQGGSINPQGIPRDKDIRDGFSMAYEGEELFGGDAKSYEVTLIDAVLPDPVLHEELLSGKSFHALMGSLWYDVPYHEMMYLKDSKDDRYARTKAADFAKFYGAEIQKLSEVLGVSEEQAQAGDEKFAQKYNTMFKQRQELAMSFCSMRQPNGIGSNVEWHEPQEYIESILGFRRYFTLENKICKVLYDLANNQSLIRSFVPPNKKSEKVIRRQSRGAQTLSGATQSALYAAAFALQAANMRAACNHIIQSPGGQITKELELTFLEHQPRGIHPWYIRTFNMHDEILIVKSKDLQIDTHQILKDFIDKYRKVVPLLDWEWDKLQSWGTKED